MWKPGNAILILLTNIDDKTSNIIKIFNKKIGAFFSGEELIGKAFKNN